MNHPEIAVSGMKKNVEVIVKQYQDPVRRVRDADRREYRRRILLLLILQFIAAPVRVAGDVLLAHPWMKDYQHLKLYAVLLPLAYVIALWTIGIWWVFKRNY
jgi:hypothetical protein